MKNCLIRKKFINGFVIFSFILISIMPNACSDIKENINIMGKANINNDSFEFYPTDLATISETNPDENNKNFEIIPFDQETLFKFNISSLPVDTPIYSAKIYAKFNSYTDQDPYGYNLSCYRLTSNWNEDTVAWNTKPSNYSFPTSNATIPFTFILMSWDVKNDLLSFIDGKEDNYGWKINCEHEIFENTSLGFGNPVLIIKTEANQPPNIPDKPSGPLHVNVGIMYPYSTITIDPEDDKVRYGWDWNGSGTVDIWSEFQSSNSKQFYNNRWTSVGTYQVKVKAEDIYGEQSNFSQILTVIVGEGYNNPPNKPNTPTGESSGKIDTEYQYSTSSIDSDGDQLFYLWDWGDGHNSFWLGPYDSGETCEAIHIWDDEGGYNIKVKAKDQYGVESSWSDPLSITMPIVKIFNQIPRIIIWLFEHFPFLQPYFSNYI